MLLGSLLLLENGCLTKEAVKRKGPKKGSSLSPFPFFFVMEGLGALELNFF